jgi:hypothetical protein
MAPTKFSLKQRRLSEDLPSARIIGELTEANKTREAGYFTTLNACDGSHIVKAGKYLCFTKRLRML